MTVRPKVGDIVECQFLDHVEDGGDPLEFIVWGRLVKVTRRHYEIVSWAYADPGREGGDRNEKRWTIVRKAVTRIAPMIVVPASVKR